MSQKRLVADPNLGIMDIQGVILGHWNKHKDFDLLTYLDCPGHQKWSWKTAPNVVWMSKTADLMSGFFRIALNGVLQSQKVKGALLKIAQGCKINRSRFCDTDWSDKCDLRLRTILAQFRELKKKADVYATAMRKASAEEKIAIDGALSLMQLETLEPFSQELAIVPYQAPSTAAPSKTTNLPSSSSALAASPSCVFKKILQKQDSSPGKVSLATVAAEVTKTTTTMLARRSSSSSQFVVPPDDVTSSPSKSPIKVEKKNKKKRKSKGLSVALEDEPQTPKKKERHQGNMAALDEEEQNILQSVLEEEVPRDAAKRTRRTKKRPAVKPKSKTVKKRPAAKIEKSKVSAEEGPGLDTTSCKSSFRHRRTSSAYHAAKKQAEREGKSPRTAKNLARAAFSRMGAQVDAGLVQEKL